MKKSVDQTKPSNALQLTLSIKRLQFIIRGGFGRPKFLI